MPHTPFHAQTERETRPGEGVSPKSLAFLRQSFQAQAQAAEERANRLQDEKDDPGRIFQEIIGLSREAGLLDQPSAASTFRALGEEALGFIPRTFEASLGAFPLEAERARADFFLGREIQRRGRREGLEQFQRFAPREQAAQLGLFERFGPRAAEAIAQVQRAGDPLAAEARDVSLRGLLERAQRGGALSPDAQREIEQGILREQARTGGTLRGIAPLFQRATGLGLAAEARQRQSFLDLLQGSQQAAATQAALPVPTLPGSAISPFITPRTEVPLGLPAGALGPGVQARGQDISQGLGIAGLGAGAFGQQLAGQFALRQAELGVDQGGGGLGRIFGTLAGSFLGPVGAAVGGAIGSRLTGSPSGRNTINTASPTATGFGLSAV